MRNQDTIKRFNDDIDHLLQTGMMDTSAEGASNNETAEMLTLAHRLSVMDFSKQSQKRYAIRQRLLDVSSANVRVNPKEKKPMFIKIQNRRIQLAFPAVAFVAIVILLTAFLLWPNTVVAAAQNVINFFEELWIGEQTTIMPFDPGKIVVLEDGKISMTGVVVEETELVEDKKLLETTGMVEIDIRQFDNLVDAQAAVEFQLQIPGYLPEGYSLSRVSVWGEGDSAYANLGFEGPDGSILLIQRPLNGDKAQTVSIGIPEGTPFEETMVNGSPAIWASHTLLWEADFVSFLLNGQNLILAEATLIAESLE